MTHAWCSDPSRDAGVRAAEDGRDRPLPTLEEAIAAPFADAAERSSTVSETGEGQSGLRTERVTLEITHPSPNSLHKWQWDMIVRRYCESVRVVEEELSDAWAQRLARLTAERDAAIRERDALRAARITQALTADRFAAAVQEADTLRARVAELEAKLAPDAHAEGESNHAAPAASGVGEGEEVGRE